eukprot:TRINITY_DN23889_c0_g1_i1.p1 TRINITY_DN23889_c0_g1~~TRINITY_DN23889_c0_g1_i1.p1  ORF type:complete len:170 (+),score=11.38 TRINITY_DN23889_c0_g1_i1:149-658(+)
MPSSSSQSAQFVALVYVLPVLVMLLACATPVAIMSYTGQRPVMEQLRDAHSKMLTGLSLLIFVFSAPLLLSNYLVSSLYQYSLYCLLLAAANIVAESIGKRRFWPGLMIWQAINLMNLLGCWGVVQLGNASNPGILKVAFAAGATGTRGDGCPIGDFSVEWCDDAWVTR